MSQPLITSRTPSLAGDIPARALALAGQLRAALLGGADRVVDRRNALTAFAVRVASAAILFLSQIALARWMGADQYGIYVYAWTLVLLLGGLSTAGLNLGAIRIVSELRERAAHDALRGFLLGGRLFVALLATVLTAVALAVVAFFAARLPAGPWVALAIILMAVPAYALTDVQDGICRGSARIASALVAPYILRPLLVLAAIYALHFIGFPLDAAFAAKAAVLATWSAWVIQTCIVQRDMKAIVPPGSRTYDVRGWTSTTAPLLLMGLFDLAMQNMDVIVISNLLSPTEAGIYFAGAKTMALILFVHYAVGSALANRFSAIATRGDADAMRVAVRDAVRWTFWPALGLTLVMLALGQPLLALFGPKFSAGYPVMCVLAVAILARSAIGPAEALLSMTGGQRDCARSLMIAALANLVLSLTLTPVFGILGAAVAVGTATMLGALLNWRAARRNLGLDVGIWAAHGQLPGAPRPGSAA